MFMKSMLFALLFNPVLAQNENIGQEPIVISNAPEHFARDIFVGPDNEMPTNGRWIMSLEPTTVQSGEPSIPKNLSEAFHEMEHALPHWYQVALRRSSGEFECFVSINNFDVNLFVMDWFWVNWRLEEPDSELRNVLEGMGAENRYQMLFGLHDGFCYYLKYGEEKAMEMLTASADEDDKERLIPPLESSGCDKH